MEHSPYKQNYFWIVITILIISLAGVGFGIKLIFFNESSPTQPNEEDTSKCTQKIPDNIETDFVSDYEGDYPWWNENFSNFKQISLKASDHGLKNECLAVLQFDHKNYAKNGRARADGADLRLVYYSDNKYEIVPIQISDPNTKKIKIFFNPVKSLSPSEIDPNYFLYYGNYAAKPQKASLESETYLQNYTVSINREVHPLISGGIDRHWIVDGIDEYSQVTYNLSIDSSIKPEEVPRYKLIGTSKSGELRRVNATDYQVTISTKDFAPGEYKFQSTFTADGQTQKSTIIPFFVSKPIFVTWTMDWEGGDTPNHELDNLEQFSEKHNIPVTQFFNPSIYLNITNDVSDQRAKYLTDWIKKRQEKGDEIGLHLHMHYKLIETIGIPVRKSPQWTPLDNGHTVPMTAYSYEEQKKMLQWSQEKFAEKGLLSPTSFRGGGWFANLDTLQALEDTGFRVDSSGRDYYEWGSNRLKGYWNLSTTTKPYRPSKTNQNSPTPAPNFLLMEFPNNGRDSLYYESADLIAAFEANYPSHTLSEAQAVTYLSHPHDISEDIKTLDPAFNHMDQYLAENDQGPVIYCTLEEAYKYFTQ